MGTDCGNNPYIDRDALVGTDARPQALRHARISAIGCLDCGGHSAAEIKWADLGILNRKRAYHNTPDVDQTKVDVIATVGVGRSRESVTDTRSFNSWMLGVAVYYVRKDTHALYPPPGTSCQQGC